MSTRILVSFLPLVLLAACGSSDPGGTAGVVDHAAVWQFDNDANIAYPTCWSCGADVDGGVTSCDGCGVRVHVEAMSIACPECKGAKVCDHCAEGHVCVPCDGTGHCPICDGTGAWRGETCPECEDVKACLACAGDAAAEACERCADTSVCANCEGEGEIVLR